jgi:NADPH:quinone reductase-like Zn-dependent oxidoreductase
VDEPKKCGRQRSTVAEAPVLKATMELLECETPEPGPRDLLVEVRAISVNPVDAKIRWGEDRSIPREQCRSLAGMRRE